jgi:hypothetical protein
MFPPLDMKYCGFCFEEIISHEQDNIDWPAHLENIHNTNEKNLTKIFPLLQYGHPLFNYAFFPLDQSPLHTVVTEFKIELDINIKCPLNDCTTSFANEDRMNEHLAKMSKKYNSKYNPNLPPFWRFLKLNCHDKKCPPFSIFYRFLNTLGLKVKYSNAYQLFRVYLDAITLVLLK